MLNEPPKKFIFIQTDSIVSVISRPLPTTSLRPLLEAKSCHPTTDSKALPVCSFPLGEAMDSSSSIKSPSKIMNPNILRQDLHKELLFNQKIGKNILDQKSELRKVWDKRSEDQKRKEMENNKLSRRSSFEKRLEERFLKCEPKPDINLITEPHHDDVPEFMKIRAKFYARTMH